MEHERMNVFVIGASGYIGRRLRTGVDAEPTRDDQRPADPLNFVVIAPSVALSSGEAPFTPWIAR